MEESILISIKKLLGIDKDNKDFDKDVIMHINTALLTLNQIGVGPAEGFLIEDDSATWEDLLGNRKDLDAAKTHIYLKVKLVFDTPLNSSVIQANKESINELEWRLNLQAESK